MKKLILVFLLVFTATFAAVAEQQVGLYQNAYFGKDFTIEAAQKNSKLSDVYIGVTAKDSKNAFIDVSGDDLDYFKQSLIQVRDKYLDWVKVAKENNVTEMSKEFGIKFPSVNIAWKGSKWWFSFRVKVNMSFLILDNGKMVAKWTPKVTSSSNQFIDETIYFVFESEDDFNNLISQLDYDTIMNKLLSTKKNEDLFN